SAMIGKFILVPCVSSMSPIQPLCEATGSTDRAIPLTLRFSNSLLSLAEPLSSVVQTGVKSAGCENSTPHLSPRYSWNLILPSDDSCSKSGAMLPRCRPMGVSLFSGHALGGQGQGI